MKAPNNLKRIAALGAAGLVALSALTACSSDSDEQRAASDITLPSNPATGEAIKIGFITPEGGAISLPELRQAGEAATRYLNENGGGIGGHKIDLVVCSQHEEPASAQKCANDMVEKGVSLVVTPLGAQGAVMLPVIAKAGIPYVAQAPVSQVEMVTPGAYMLSGGIVGSLGAQAVTAAKTGVKKVAVFTGDTGDAASSIKALGDPMFKAAGVELDVVTIPVSAADPTPQITAAMKGDPGAVTFLGDTKQCITGIKALNAVAPDVTKYLISTCLDRPVVEAVGADVLKGSKAITTVNLSSDEPTVKLYRDIMGKYAPDTDPQGIAYLAYQLVMATAEVGKSLTGDTGPEAFHQAFKTAKDVPMPAAPGLTFTCDGKAVPRLTALCSKAALVSDIGEDMKFENSEVVNKN